MHTTALAAASSVVAAAQSTYSVLHSLAEFTPVASPPRGVLVMRGTRLLMLAKLPHVDEPLDLPLVIVQAAHLETELCLERRSHLRECGGRRAW